MLVYMLTPLIAWTAEPRNLDAMRDYVAGLFASKLTTLVNEGTDSSLYEMSPDFWRGFMDHRASLFFRNAGYPALTCKFQNDTVLKAFADFVLYQDGAERAPNDPPRLTSKDRDSIAAWEGNSALSLTGKLAQKVVWSVWGELSDLCDPDKMERAESILSWLPASARSKDEDDPTKMQFVGYKKQ